MQQQQYIQFPPEPQGREYLIFSDESGNWHYNSGDLYVRSWVRITPEQYRSLQNKVLLLKRQTGIIELKWGNLAKNPNIFNDIFSQVEFKVFITVSDPQHFNPKIYTIVSDVNALPPSTGGIDLTEKIKDTMKKSAYNQLFLAFYEHQHIENSVRALLTQLDLPHCKYLIDSPQFPPDDWTERAEICGILKGNVKIIKNSSNEPGIELADLIAGCVRDLLDNSPIAQSIYQKYIYDHMMDTTSSVYPNPNLIFHPKFPRDVRNALLSGFRPYSP